MRFYSLIAISFYTIIFIYLCQFLLFKKTSLNRSHKKARVSKLQNKFMQVYISCNNTFNPPIPEILSHKIQCTTSVEGYECGESKAYLDFIIDTYDNPLADIYIFMHGHNTAWHFINPLTRTMKKLINSTYINQENYGGFQCYWNYGPTVITTENPAHDLIKLLFKKTNVEIDNFGNWSYPCCGTYFVHTDQIRNRPKSEYIQMIENLKEWTNKDLKYKKQFGNKYDGFCGRIFEMMWNRILSNTSYVKLPPYCNTEDKMRKNPIHNLNEFKKIYK